MPLTGKKRQFANAVLAGKSNKDAAIAAGYSAATASAAGSRLVKDAEVSRFLVEARGRREEGAEVTAGTPKFDLSQALLHADPKQFLLAAMNDGELDAKYRIDAAKALMPFLHQKLGEGGKKDLQAAAAKRAGSGRYSSAAPPKLVASGGRKL